MPLFLFTILLLFIFESTNAQWLIGSGSIAGAKFSETDASNAISSVGIGDYSTNSAEPMAALE